ncbi:DNA alkylation repair protein [Peptoniphilus sp. KCTC 25270]|uniref:DNA alkylation repair protein n=1 Tax=Peptoniphilus sp. KCTC 25270 TaxID=2897414 RepID=UPI001E63ADF4|nr:DNA alkylation repair protein [Peptoniphilus sp. KCTC 25270]MCD1147804.1 DNA alkylation repair protein [Peptoniphilus sp. KCTC 25270]
MDIQEELFFQKDEGYKKFQEKIIPNIDPDTIIGVRMPEIKRIAKEWARREEVELFLGDLPHKYYEENQLHCQILVYENNFFQAQKKVESLLPYLDNWALTDGFVPRAFKKEKKSTWDLAKKWVCSSEEYTIRYGILLMMKLHLKSDFWKEAMREVAGISSEFYYVNMAIAWFFAEALFYYEEETIDLYKKRILSPWVQNKSIQKARESRRISQELKEKLKDYKR